MKANTKKSVKCFTTHRSLIGRPRFVIKYDQLKMLLEHRFSVQQIANMLGVSVSTVHRRMEEFNLSVSASYATITDYELDSLVSDIQHHFPMCGNCQMEGQLARVQQRHIREAQRRVDPEGSMLRRLNALQRRVYKVAAPLSLAHGRQPSIDKWMATIN